MFCDVGSPFFGTLSGISWPDTGACLAREASSALWIRWPESPNEGIRFGLRTRDEWDSNSILPIYWCILKTVLKPTLRAVWEGQKQESHRLRSQGKPAKKMFRMKLKQSLYFHCCEKYLGWNSGMKFLPFHLLLCPHDRSAGHQSEQFDLKLPPISND